MIYFITAILFSFSANIDNIIIGISYGIKKIHISIFKNFIISSFTALFSFLSMYLGSSIALLLSETTANLLGAFTLMIIGIYTFLKEFFQKRKEISLCQTRTLNRLNLRELITIIMILSINNIAVGVAASVAGIDILVATICTFLFSFVLLKLGNFIGHKAMNNKFIEKYSNVISSIILIIIGILQI